MNISARKLLLLVIVTTTVFVLSTLQSGVSTADALIEAGMLLAAVSFGVVLLSLLSTDGSSQTPQEAQTVEPPDQVEQRHIELMRLQQQAFADLAAQQEQVTTQVNAAGAAFVQQVRGTLKKATADLKKDIAKQTSDVHLTKLIHKAMDSYYERQSLTRLKTSHEPAARLSYLQELLQKRNLTGLDLQGVDIQGAMLDNAEANGVNFNAANLTEVSLVNAQMKNAQFKDANLAKADLTKAILLDANLEGAKLEGATLIETKCGRVNLTGANLRDADIRGTGFYLGTLRNADMTGANLKAANLVDIDLQGAILAEVICNWETILPDKNAWEEGTDLTRFTDPQHPDFWRSDNKKSPAFQLAEPDKVSSE